MSCPDRIIEIAVTAARYYPVRKLAQSYAEFVLRGSSTPFTAIYEGKQGTGKTTFAIFTLLGVLALYTVYLFEPDVLRGVVRFQGFPPRDKVEKYNRSFYEACKALCEGDLDAVIDYLKRHIAFGPVDFVARVKEFVKSNPHGTSAEPCLILDDAGIFFFRSLWQGGSKSWKRAVTHSLALMQVMRSFTAGLIVTTPSRDMLITRLERMLEHDVYLMRSEETDTLQIIIGGRVRVLTTNCYAKYFNRATRLVAGRPAKVLEDITAQVSVKGSPRDPVFITGREIIDEVLREVWEVRQQWIAHTVGLIERELRREISGVEEEEAEEEPEIELE